MFICIKILVLILLLFAAFKDIKSKEISAVTIIACGLLSALVLGIRLFLKEDISAFVLALLPGVIMLIISVVTRGGVGLGDGLLLASIGPVFGFDHVVLGICAALGLTSIVSIALLLLKKGNGKTRLPFVPFIAVGMGVMMFA